MISKLSVDRIDHIIGVLTMKKNMCVISKLTVDRIYNVIGV